MRFRATPCYQRIENTSVIPSETSGACQLLRTYAQIFFKPDGLSTSANAPWPRRTPRLMSWPMCASFQIVGKILVCTAALTAAALASPHPARALTCSVLREHPCIYRPCHQVCGVFHRRPCAPELEYTYIEQLLLTMDSRHH